MLLSIWGFAVVPGFRGMGRSPNIRMLHVSSSVHDRECCRTLHLLTALNLTSHSLPRPCRPVSGFQSFQKGLAAACRV